MQMMSLAALCAAMLHAECADDWRDKFYDGLEAQGEVVRQPKGYRETEPAILLRHISGAKIFGAEKSLQTNLKGPVEWTVAAEVRGTGSAEAGMAMEFFNAQGRTLGIQQGEGVKASGAWARHEWTFTAPPTAVQAFLHILSLDAGPVSFARVSAVAAPGKETDEMPFAAYALPFTWNKDWNGGRFLFTSFAEAPQPMAFHFKGNRGKLKAPALEIDMPDNLEIRDAFTEHDEFWGPERPVSEQTHTRSGQTYRRIRYEGLRVFKIIQPEGYGWERKLALVPAPKKDTIWEDCTYRCYWRLCDGARTGKESAIDIRFVKLPVGLRSPKRFRVISWQSDDRLYSDNATFMAAAKAWEMAGLTTFVRRRGTFARGRELIDLLKARNSGWRFMFTFPDLWGIRFLASDTPEYKALNAPPATWTDGRESRKLCPDYFTKDSAFASYFRDRIVRARLEACGVESGDLIGFDFEPWSSGMYCMCDRCRAAFAKRQGLAAVPSAKDIVKMPDEWAAFRCDQTEASVAMICRAVREWNPNLTLADYDYYQAYGLPDRRGEKEFYRGCAKSSKQNEKWFDMHICSYYHIVDRRSFLAISNNTVHLEKPYLPLGAVGGYGGYLRAGEVRTPNQIRMLALAAAVHGCPGTGFYCGLHYDGEHLLALMKARDQIAAIERFPWGKRKGRLHVESASPELMHASCADAEGEAVALFNYDRRRPVRVRISAVAAMRRLAEDPVCGKRLSPGAVDLKDGFELDVPPEDVRFVTFRKPRVAVRWRAKSPAVGRESSCRFKACFYDSTSTQFLGESDGTMAADGTVSGAWMGAEPCMTYRTFFSSTDASGKESRTVEAEFATLEDATLDIDYATGLNFRKKGGASIVRAVAIGETAAIQRMIDDACARGGGTVTLDAGDHPVTSIFLTSNVTLELKRAARLYAASTNRDDYMDAVLGIPGDHRTREWRDCCTAVICANGATNIAIVGEGVIDGNCGQLGDLSGSPGRYRNIVLYRSSGIRIEGVTLKDAARWTCYFKECENVLVRGVTVRSVKCWGNDGFDIEARHVLIENCDIEADDDAICLKAFNPDYVVEDVEVRNCRIAANCDHIKIGTETFGGFRNIRVQDCELVSCSTNLIPRVKNAMYGVDDGIPGWSQERIASRCGIALECVDGGFIENVRISGIKMNRSTQTPVFIRLGERRGRVGDGRPYLRDVVIEDVTGEAVSQIASSITGVPGLRPSGITVRNARLKLMGGVTAAEASRPVPEAEKEYPTNKMFGKHPLPAYGFYVRHADGVTFENVALSTDRPDSRPAIVQEDCTSVSVR